MNMKQHVRWVAAQAKWCVWVKFRVHISTHKNEFTMGTRSEYDESIIQVNAWKRRLYAHQ